MSKSDPRAATSHITPFGLRMQPELKERLEQAASEAGRSLNAEIITRLESSFGAGEDAMAQTAIARLTMQLATAELNKHSLEVKVRGFASMTQKTAELLLQYLKAPDANTQNVLNALIEQAKPYIRETETMDAELLERVEAIRAATRQMSVARDQLMAKFGLAPDEGAKAPLTEEAAPPTPPKRPPRVIRSATKQKLE